jgi:hypothetical protein
MLLINIKSRAKKKKKKKNINSSNEPIEDRARVSATGPRQNFIIDAACKIIN